MNQDWLAQLPITNIIDYRAVSGGDINDAYKIDTTDHEYFLKVQVMRSTLPVYPYLPLSESLSHGRIY